MIQTKKVRRICFIGCYDAPQGAGSRTWNFCKELDKLGYEITFVTSNYNHSMPNKLSINKPFYKTEEIGSIKVVWINSINYKNSYPLRFLHMALYSMSVLTYALFNLKKNQVFLSPSVPLPLSLVGYAIAKIFKAKFIFEIRDVWPEELIDLGYITSKGFVARILRVIEKFICKRADSIISVLPNVTSHLKNINEKIEFTYIPNPQDKIEGILPYEGGQEGKLKVLYAGGSGAAQDIEGIIDSFMISSESFSGMSLNIVGPKERADNHIERLSNVPKNIKTYSPVIKSQLSSFFNDADLTICAIKDCDLLKFGINSNKLYDYMNSGRLVLLAAKIEENPVSTSGCGFFVPPEDINLISDAINKAYEMSPKSRREMGKRGISYMKHHSLSLLTQKYVNVLES